MTSLKSVVSRENQLLSLLHVGPETHILMTPLCFMYSEEGPDSICVNDTQCRISQCLGPYAEKQRKPQTEIHQTWIPAWKPESWSWIPSPNPFLVRPCKSLPLTFSRQYLAVISPSQLYSITRTFHWVWHSFLFPTINQSLPGFLKFSSNWNS